MKRRIGPKHAILRLTMIRRILSPGISINIGHSSFLMLHLLPGILPGIFPQGHGFEADSRALNEKSVDPCDGIEPLDNFRLDRVAGDQQSFHFHLVQKTLEFPMPSKNGITVNALSLQLRIIIEKTYRRKFRRTVVENFLECEHAVR